MFVISNEGCCGWHLAGATLNVAYGGLHFRDRLFPSGNCVEGTSRRYNSSQRLSGHIRSPLIQAEKSKRVHHNLLLPFFSLASPIMRKNNTKGNWWKPKQLCVRPRVFI
jgi:hypothetical protein